VKIVDDRPLHRRMKMIKDTIGPVTVATFMRHTVEAARKQFEIKRGNNLLVRVQTGISHLILLSSPLPN
jgi:hypothetical protein